MLSPPKPKFTCEHGHTLAYAREYCIKCEKAMRGPNGEHAYAETSVAFRRVKYVLGARIARDLLAPYAPSLVYLKPENYDAVYADCQNALETHYNAVCIKRQPALASVPIVVGPRMNEHGEPDVPLSPVQIGTHIDSLPTHAPVLPTAKVKLPFMLPGDTLSASGLRTLDDVRDMVRRVAVQLSKQDAKAVLMRCGDGAEKVADLKPVHFDPVYARCAYLLKDGRDDVSNVLRRVVLERGKQTAKDILFSVGGGAETALDLQPGLYAEVISACEDALRKPTLSSDTADTDFMRAEPPPGIRDELDDVTAYKLEFFEGLGDALIGYNRDETQRTVIGTFQDRRYAERVLMLLQSAKACGSPNNSYSTRES